MNVPILGRDSEDSESTWAIDIGRPVIHQMFPDGSHVIHICRGGKSRIHSDLLQELMKMEQAGHSKRNSNMPFAAVKAVPAPYYRQFDKRKF